jgi:hypothetical protein
MNQKLMEILQTNPRMWDYYQVGPVQRAVLTDLVHDVINSVLHEVCDEVQYEHDWELSYIVVDRVRETFGVTP